VSLPVRLCPFPVHVRVGIVSVFLNFAMLIFNRLIFNGPFSQWVTFNAYLLPEKSMDNFKSYFCCQWTTFSGYIQDGRQQITFRAYFDPFNRLNQRKLLFETILSISAYRHGDIET
jgi:hypothetical protein